MNSPFSLRHYILPCSHPSWFLTTTTISEITRKANRKRRKTEIIQVSAGVGRYLGDLFHESVLSDLFFVLLVVFHELS